MSIRNFLVAASVGLSSIAAQQASAVLVPVANNSFETPVPFATPTSWTGRGPAPAKVTTGNGGGLTAPDGVQAVLIGNGGDGQLFSNNLPLSLQPNTIYATTAFIGWRNDDPNPTSATRIGAVQLVQGGSGAAGTGTVLANSTKTFNAAAGDTLGKYYFQTGTFTTGGSVAADPVRVELLSTVTGGIQTWYDRVRVGAFAVNALTKLPVVNPSFEIGAPASGGFAEAIPGWVEGAGDPAGISDFGPAQFAGVEPVEPDGDNAATFKFFGGSIRQDVAANFKDGELYRLSFAVGERNDESPANHITGFTATIRRADTDAILSTLNLAFPTIPRGSFATFTLDYMSDILADGGAGIRIQFEKSAGGAQAALDNVVLLTSVVGVPEPTTLGLLLLTGAAGLARRRRVVA